MGHIYDIEGYVESQRIQEPGDVQIECAEHLDPVVEASGKRMKLLELIESRLIDIGHQQTEAQQNELCDVLLRLVQDADRELRRRVTSRLASLEWVSHDLVVYLANDDIEVAYDILMRSPVLIDEDLIEIVHRRGFQHRLAVAWRPNIGEDVSEALAAHSEPKVMVKLLQNESARIKEATVLYLISQCSRQDEYRIPLMQRTDLPAHANRMMLRMLAIHLTDRVTHRYGREAELLQSIFMTAAAEVDDREKQDAIETIIEALDGNPYVALGLLKAGEAKLFFHLISKMSGLRLRKVEVLFASSNLEALAILCRCLKFEPDAYYVLVRLVLEARNDNISIPNKQAIVSPYQSICINRATETLERWRKEGNG